MIFPANGTEVIMDQRKSERLDVEGVKQLLLKLDYIQEMLNA